MVLRIASVAVLIGILLAGGCSNPKSIFETPSPSTPGGPSIPTAAATLLDVTFAPRALSGGVSGRGTVLFTLPVPGGVSVQLTTSDPVLMIPSSVAVPAGVDHIDFPIAAGVVGRDTSVSVNAAVGVRTVNRTLDVWADLPTFLSWFSDVGDSIGGGDFGRLTTSNAVFVGTGNVTQVSIRVTGAGLEFWSLEFAPPRGGQLRVGSYEHAQRSAFRDNVSPGLDVSGRSRGCNALAGRFDVLEADFAASQVNRFRARFEQHCENSSAALIGEVRFTSGAR